MLPLGSLLPPVFSLPHVGPLPQHCCRRLLLTSKRASQHYTNSDSCTDCRKRSRPIAWRCFNHDLFPICSLHCFHCSGPRKGFAVYFSCGSKTSALAVAPPQGLLSPSQVFINSLKSPSQSSQRDGSLWVMMAISVWFGCLPAVYHQFHPTQYPWEHNLTHHRSCFHRLADVKN